MISLPPQNPHQPFTGAFNYITFQKLTTQCPAWLHQWLKEIILLLLLLLFLIGNSLKNCDPNTQIVYRKCTKKIKSIKELTNVQRDKSPWNLTTPQPRRIQVAKSTHIASSKIKTSA